MLPKPEFVWVRDKNSRHQYPVAKHALRAHHEVIEDHPAVDAVGNPLPPKPFVPKGAGLKSTARSTSQSTPEEPAESKEG